MQFQKRINEFFETISPEIKETTELGVEKLLKILSIKESLPEIALRFWNGLMGSEQLRNMLLILFVMLLSFLVSFGVMMSSGVFILCTLIAWIM